VCCSDCDSDNCLSCSDSGLAELERECAVSAICPGCELAHGGGSDDCHDSCGCSSDPDEYNDGADSCGCSSDPDEYNDGADPCGCSSDSDDCLKWSESGLAEVERECAVSKRLARRDGSSF